MSLIEYLNLVYPDRRDRYGYTILRGKRAIRAIKRSEDEALRRLLDTDLLDCLASKQFILPFKKITDNKSDYTFIVQNLISPIVTPSEWSSSMYLDAALLIAKSEVMLASRDMTIDDPHPWNVLFYNGRPYITDLGSFNVPETGLHWSLENDKKIWPASGVYEAFFENPLSLILAGRGPEVRQSLQSWHPFSGMDTAALLLREPSILIPFLLKKLIAKQFENIWKISYKFLTVTNKRYLRSLYIGLLMYYANRIRSRLEMKSASGIRMQISGNTVSAIDEVLLKAVPKNILVYGGDIEYFRHLRSSNTARMTFISPDESIIDNLYRTESDSPALAVMDLRSPTPGTGPNNQWVAPAFLRYRSEFAIFCFDLEELVIEKCMRVSELIAAVDTLALAGAVIVFMKPCIGSEKRSRDYGQTNDEVILACLAQQLECFNIIANGSAELVVNFERGIAS